VVEISISRLDTIFKNLLAGVWSWRCEGFIVFRVLQIVGVFNQHNANGVEK
jgi:hypothetical protein